MTAQFLRTLSHISFATGGFFLGLSAVLFFVLKIPKAVKEIKGLKKEKGKNEPEETGNNLLSGSEETVLLKDDETKDLA